ncbi:MAG TPA: Fur family transcriptional regulator [Methylocystis sp.]|nr:Fur family transcriptional regulator [Methylocystis sp.]
MTQRRHPRPPLAASRGLTPARRRALEILTRAKKPVGAYEMIELMCDDAGKRPAPISVYRALAYLLEHGLAHRLASQNAFVVCDHEHGAREPVVFLICDACHEVREATSPALARELAALAGHEDFSPGASVVEIAGRCKRCAEAEAERP